MRSVTLVINNFEVVFFHVPTQFLECKDFFSGFLIHAGSCTDYD